MYFISFIMRTALINLNLAQLPVSSIKSLSTYDKAVLTGKLPKKICEELDNEEWSKPYTDVDEMFKDLITFS